MPRSSEYGMLSPNGHIYTMTPASLAQGKLKKTGGKIVGAGGPGKWLMIVSPRNERQTIPMIP